MKALCSQELVSPHRWGSAPIRSLRSRLHPRYQGVYLGSQLHKGEQGERAGSKVIDLYAFSWGIPRKPAWNLVETTQRKSQVICPPAKTSPALWSGNHQVVAAPLQ